MSACMSQKKINFLFLSNRKLFNTWAEQVYDFFSVDKRTHTISFKLAHTQVGRHQSGPVVMSFHLSFIFILHFHHSLASCTLSPCSYSLLSFFASLIVFHHLSIAPFCCSFKLIAFLSVSSLSYQASLPRSVSLPQASCVYISVVYFYKCQTVFLPSVYWSTERESDGEREAEKKGEGSDRERSKKKRYRGRDGRYEGTEWQRNEVREEMEKGQKVSEVEKAFSI